MNFISVIKDRCVYIFIVILTLIAIYPSDTYSQPETPTATPEISALTPSPTARSHVTPTPILDQSIDQLTVLVPYLSVNYYTAGSYDALSVETVSGNVFLTKTIKKRTGWLGHDPFERFYQILGPIQLSNNSVSASQIPLWGEYQNYSANRIIALPNEKVFSTSHRRNGSIHTQQKTSPLNNERIGIAVENESVVYIGENVFFPGVPAGSLLVYEGERNTPFVYFDPQSSDRELIGLPVPNPPNLIRHLHIGPSGLIFAVMNDPNTGRDAIYRFDSNGIASFWIDLEDRHINIVDITYLPNDDSFYYIVTDVTQSMRKKHFTTFLAHLQCLAFADPFPGAAFPLVTLPAG